MQAFNKNEIIILTNHKCSIGFAEMDDTGMICHKPFNYKGLGNGQYWT